MKRIFVATHRSFGKVTIHHVAFDDPAEARDFCASANRNCPRGPGRWSFSELDLREKAQ